MAKLLSACALLCAAVVLAGCPSTQDGGGEAEPAATDETASQVAFQLGERDLFPEGIAYDPVSDSFFLGSIRKSKILKIARDGTVEEFVPSRYDGLMAVLGMKVDAERRVLWANSYTSRMMEGYAPDAPGKTGIFKFNLENGSLIDKYVIDIQVEGQLFNDMALADDGSIYVTSYGYGTIFKVDAGTNELTEFAPMPEGARTNGIDISPDQKYLFVSGGDKYYRVTMADGEVVELTLPDGAYIGYIDGMYWHDNSVVAIASGETDGEEFNRVVRLHLSENMDGIERIDVLDENNPLYSAPTTGAIVDGWLYYIATAQFGMVDEYGNPAPWNELSDIYILKIKL